MRALLMAIMLTAFEHSGADEPRLTEGEVALMMRRILLVLAVALVMSAMLVATAVPALAKGNPNQPFNPYADVTDDHVRTSKAIPATHIPSEEEPRPRKSASAGGNPGGIYYKTVCLRNADSC